MVYSKLAMEEDHERITLIAKLGLIRIEPLHQLHKLHRFCEIQQLHQDLDLNDLSTEGALCTGECIFIKKNNNNNTQLVMCHMSMKTY